MAASVPSSGDLKKEELDDMTTCCICADIYTDARVLPCIHTFCMKCIQETSLQTNKGPGDEMPCPICRRLFKIPQEGFHGLPKNFFIERLIEVAQVSDSSAASRAVCSVCLEESKEDEGKETPMADSYCVDCKYKLCKECCREHRNYKLTKNHKLIPINEHEGDQNMLANLAQSVCERHERNVLNVYCADCKTVVCAICFIEDHKNHECSHVNKFVDGFRKEIENNTEAINKCTSEAQMKKTELLKVKEEMQQRVTHLECDVANRTDEIKQFADKHANSLLEGLSSKRQSKLKEIQMATDDIDAYMSNLESYNSYCQRIMAQGSAIDICRAVSDLSAGALELQQQCQTINERGIQSFNFCFRKSQLREFLEEDCGNLIGEIEEEGDSKPKKSSKEILLAEQSNEIDRLRKETEIERTDKECLQMAVEQLTINVNKEVQADKALTEKLSKKPTNYNAYLWEPEQVLYTDTTTSNTVPENSDKLKQELDTEKITNSSLQANNETFLQEEERFKTTVKSLETNTEKLRQDLDATTAVLVQTIRTKSAKKKKQSIRGLTILGKELFVVNQWNSKVDVYDSMKLSFSRQWNLKELTDPRDMGSCNWIKCLYILEYRHQSNEIFRVDPNGKLLKKWSTGDDYGESLSVTDESSVVLTLYNKNKLKEYSPDGQLIREINLAAAAGIRYPFHAIKLASGHFVVSHGQYSDDLHIVCVVDGDGKLQKSFGGKRGSTIEQMDVPFYLAVDGSGFVMVADSGNSRVLLLDSDLQFQREILSIEKHGLRSLQRILLDQTNGRLLVVDNELENQRILIFVLK